MINEAIRHFTILDVTGAADRGSMALCIRVLSKCFRGSLIDKVIGQHWTLMADSHYSISLYAAGIYQIASVGHSIDEVVVCVALSMAYSRYFISLFDRLNEQPL